MFADVSLGNCQISVRKGCLQALLAPVMGLPASVIAKPLIAPALSTSGMGTAQRDYPAAVFAAGDVAT
jgi:hypothetical protein